MTPEQPPEDTRRRRLVISLGQLSGAKKVQRSGGRTGKRRWPCVLAVLGITVIVVALLIGLGGFLWWRNYKTTPAYSLALLVDAVHRNDTPTVDQIVNTDKIIDNLANQVTEATNNRYGAALTPALRKRIEALIPTLLPRLKESIRSALTAKVKELAASSESRPFVVVALGLPYLVNISTEGDNAKVSATLRERPLELTMQRNGERWQVTAIKDETLLPGLVDELIKDLPAIGLLEALDTVKKGISPGSQRRRRR